MSIQQDTNNVEQALFGCLIASHQCVNMNKPSGKADISMRHEHCLKATIALKDTKISGVTANAMTLIKDLGLELGIDSTGIDGKTTNVFAKTVNGSGLNAKNQAYYICQAVQNMVMHYLDGKTQATNAEVKEAIARLAQDMVPSVEEEEPASFNFGAASNDNDPDDLDEDDDDDDNTVASIDGSFIDSADIMKMAKTDSVLQEAFDLHTSNANSAGNGKFFRFFNGASREKATNDMKQFKSVLNGHLASLCQLAWFRKSNDMKNTHFVPTLSKAHEVAGQRVAAAIMVLSGATKFNHNLCKYISDETSETIQQQIFGGVPEHNDLKSKYGFAFAYERGNKSTVTEDDVASIIDLL